MTKTKKEITTQKESTLQEIIGFNGKYVSSLIKSANNYNSLKNADGSKFQAETVMDFLKQYSKEFNFSVKQFIELREKADSILDSFETGHSMGCHRNLKINSKQFKSNDDLDRYANSCKWSPTYGSIKIDLSKKDLKKIQYLEGIWTVVNADGSAKWLEASGSKNTYTVEWIEGYFYGTSHSTDSLREAKRLEQKKIADFIESKKEDKEFIGYSHIRTIACDAGIKAFCRRNKLNPEFGYNLGFLKSLNDRIGQSYLEKVSK